MKPTELTIQQIERAIRKIAAKFPDNEDSAVITDIHLRASQDSGELLAFDDDEQEINRCVVDQWIENKEEEFYGHITQTLRNELKKNSALIDTMGILKPFSFVLEDDEKEPIAELYLADDDTVIIGGDIMEGLDNDLDNFLEELLEKE
ncbi:MAG: hypothetical protein K6C10_05380 [Prevotella sp.]|nr:hypothetical protein [Prevotella sp.]